MYNNSEETIKRILDIWKFIEILTPNPSITLKKYFEAAKEAYNQNKNEFIAQFEHREEKGFFLKDTPYLKPLDPSLHKEGNDTYVCWHVYIGYFNWSAAEKEISAKIDTLFGKAQNPIKDKTKTNPILTPIAGFMIDNSGMLNKESIIVSSAAWAFGKIISPDFTKQNLETLFSYNIDTIQIIKQLITAHLDESGEVFLDFAKIKKITTDLMIQLNIAPNLFIDVPEICIRKVEYQKSPVGATKSNEITTLPNSRIPQLEMFNSFFIEELELVYRKVGDFGPNCAIAKYLGAKA